MIRPPLTDSDGEVRELTIEDFARFRPIQEVDPGMLRTDGPSPRKVRIDFLLAADVVESVLASGEGYEERVETILRRAIASGDL